MNDRLVRLLKQGLLSTLILVMCSSCAVAFQEKHTRNVATGIAATVQGQKSTPQQTTTPILAPAITFTPVTKATPLSSATPAPFTCQAFEKRVVMLIEPFYLDRLTTQLEQYKKDLCLADYQLQVRPYDQESPQEIRQFLQESYQKESATPLVGALLVGNIPYAYQHLTIEFPHAAKRIRPRLQENNSVQ